MRSAAKAVLWAILISALAEPLNWFIGKWMDDHSDRFPEWLASAVATVDIVIPDIPPYLFLSFAAGAAFAFALLRGWRPAQPAEPHREAPANGPSLGAEVRLAAVNPQEEYFRQSRINVMDFYSPTNRINDDKTFSDCELFGPAIVIFFGHLSLSELAQDRCDFIAYNDNAEISNAVLFNNPTLRRCTLIRLTVLVPETCVDEVDQAFGGLQWLTRNDWPNS